MKIIFRAAFALVTLIAAMSVLGSVASAHWMGELFAQPRPQYVIGLVLCTFPIVKRFPRAGWCVLLPILFNVWYIAPLYSTAEHRVESASAELTLLHANVDRFNDEPKNAIEWLRAQHATIVSLQEVTPGFEEALLKALPDYMAVLSHPLTNSHGSIVLVRSAALLEKISAQIIHLPSTSERPLIEYVFRMQDREVALLSLFLSRPIWQRHFSYQSLELREVAKWARGQQELGREVIIIGDLNLTPWSSRFQELCRDAELVNSQVGFGVQSTWPAMLPQLFGLPIDHCLHSEHIHTVWRQPGPNIGSDHRPLSVTLRVANLSHQ
ncbi:MAG: endonuclease/exonuclease/phosphatase family protein [Candidatus Hydrogenedentes bacterium]|nr:endonuclease/exonuclease/phosphatase family protein [Candidatus Hydrogenedentota bacterium]